MKKNFKDGEKIVNLGDCKSGMKVCALLDDSIKRQWVEGVIEVFTPGRGKRKVVNLCHNIRYWDDCGDVDLHGKKYSWEISDTSAEGLKKPHVLPTPFCFTMFKSDAKSDKTPKKPTKPTKEPVKPSKSGFDYYVKDGVRYDSESIGGICIGDFDKTIKDCVKELDEITEKYTKRINDLNTQKNQWNKLFGNKVQKDVPVTMAIIGKCIVLYRNWKKKPCLVLDVDIENNYIRYKLIDGDENGKIFDSHFDSHQLINVYEDDFSCIESCKLVNKIGGYLK